MKGITIRQILNQKFKKYNQLDFIPFDPIAIPHQFTLKQDIEIAGLFAAIFAWGQRVTIINKCNDLLARMDHAPHDFILNHQEKDLLRLTQFSHRTFNDTDLLYFVYFLQQHYQKHISLEQAFLFGLNPKASHIESGLNGFREYFFSFETAPQRTKKHIASPAQHSACKRLNMYLRWMVRSDNMGVDFGIWTGIKPAQLICPLDLHVSRVARKFGLIQRKQDDWQTAIELTNALRQFDAKDPVKYDFALFGMGVEGEL